jgi:ABC-2 type transport system ATP-binding protein
MTEFVVQFSDIRHGFGRAEVLKGLCLDIPRGETIALRGLNGAGKTTTLRSLLGLITPDRGSISVLVLSPARDALEIRNRVGYLAEDQQMFDWMTVEEMLSFMAPLYRTWDRTLADSFAKEFDLPRQTRTRNLSKGKNVRLGLILALAHRPELVILDDPSMGLDPIMRRDFNRAVISHLQSEGTTLVYSSHLLYEVEAIVDSVAILHDGVIVKYSSTEALRADVKRFIISEAAFAEMIPQASILDVDRRGEDVAVIVELATEAQSSLQQSGHEFRMQDMNLDEMFEAYVTGRTELAAREPLQAAATTDA